MAISRQRPRQRGERPLMFGRDPERAQLADLLEDATAGHGSLVLINGEAGIGKTTLVTDLIQHAREQDCLVLTGGCYDLTTTPPYGPWAEALRGYRPEGDQPPVPVWFGDPEAMAQVATACSGPFERRYASTPAPTPRSALQTKSFISSHTARR